MVFNWRKALPKRNFKDQSACNAQAKETTSPYLVTPGAELNAQGAALWPSVHIAPGAHIALIGDDTYCKHYFCDWLLGFVEIANSRVSMRIDDTVVTEARHRTNAAALLGRSPLIFAETVQEALLYRTRDVRKQDLYELIDRFFGPGLRARVNPQNPLFDLAGNPVPTQALTAREHLELTQINVLLQRTPLVLLDFSTKLMLEAIHEGFRPAPALFASGKTVLAILPPGKDLAWVEATTQQKFTSSISL